MKDFSGNQMIIADGQYFSLDDYQTGLNNNVCVVGTSGSGKTRSIVVPNILQAVGSYLVVDPKGNLYRKYRKYLSARGYAVRKLNFADPADPESSKYNFFQYIHSDQDILKVAHMIVHSDYRVNSRADPFWDESGELLLVAVMAYLYRHADKKDRNLQNILGMIQNCQISEYDDDYRSTADYLFSAIGKEDPDDFAYRCYERFRQAAGRTMKSIIITLHAKMAAFDTPECRELFGDDTVGIDDVGMQRSAVFVVVSDTDRSMDRMANLFFTQAMNELCRIADSFKSGRLPVDVRFIMDDFATNVCISEFPRMISSIRSRGVSAMIIIQAESQLTHAYGEDGKTILSNCDTYVYLGGNDIDTAENVARRAHTSLQKILEMPVGNCVLFRRGHTPVYAKIFSLDPFLEEKMHEMHQSISAFRSI